MTDWQAIIRDVVRAVLVLGGVYGLWDPEFWAHPEMVGLITMAVMGGVTFWAGRTGGYKKADP